MSVVPTTLASNGAAVTACAIKGGTPALPAGLSVNATTCEISGTPTVIAATPPAIVSLVPRARPIASPATPGQFTVLTSLPAPIWWNGDSVETVNGGLSFKASRIGGNVELVNGRGLPPVRVDKHKLMEILVNLIQNAIQALAERGGPGQHLTLRLVRHDERFARIEVRDDGVGIPPANLTKVFQHGFTTKKNGHGFGLHVSANAATEMGAKLSAHSDGPGRGAAFFLDVPLVEEPAPAALVAA